MRLRNIPRAEGVIAASSLVVQEPKENRGHWAEVFGNGRPIHIEVGMGKGKFLTEVAERNPQINFIGIERYASVLLRAVEKLQSQKGSAADAGEKDAPDGADEKPRGDRRPENLKFLCMDAAELPEVFAQGEVEKIYLNFSDPWPKERHAKRRLTSRQFLDRYGRILSPEGAVEFKTDNRELFAFSLGELEPAGWELQQKTWDLHADPELMKDNVMTEYEEKFSAKGNPICKMTIRRLQIAGAAPES